ncbi:MAG: L,D-transpeptidase [Elusimicrobia bacterium]|nr:L,D-transpeptidase [Elusimicrobiota bacterium]
MKRILIAAIVMAIAAGAQAAEMCAGQPVCFPNGLGGEMPHGQYSPFASLPVHNSGINTQNAARDAAITPVPAPVENTQTLILRAEAAANPDKFIDEHTPEEVSMMFGLFPSRYMIKDPAAVQNATVELTVDLTRQRLIVKSPALNAEFKISSGVQGHRTSGSGKCFAPDTLESMHYSSLYNNAPMPHSVFFNGNIAVHATSAANEALLGRPASHGCVRLSRADATTVFNLVRENGKNNTAICVQGAPPR